MKRLMLFMVSFFFFTSFVFAQNKVDRFCYITIEPKGPLIRKNVKLYFGSEDSLFSFKDSNELIKLQMVTKLTEAADVLNYMSNLGWKLVTIIQYSQSFPEKFYFKKEFALSDLK